MIGGKDFHEFEGVFQAEIERFEVGEMSSGVPQANIPIFTPSDCIAASDVNFLDDNSLPLDIPVFHDQSAEKRVDNFFNLLNHHWVLRVHRKWAQWYPINIWILLIYHI